MGERTSISWTHHTFNPYWGCTEISPACDNCYARTWAQRFGVKWGAGQPRRPASERTWAEPLNWDRKAAKAGERRRVFCASMADVFDNEAPLGARERLWALIRATPNLDWLLLTKRIGNAPRMLPADWGAGYPNVWLMATIANQEEAGRDVAKLLAIPAVIHALSVEPMLGPVDLTALPIPRDALLPGYGTSHGFRFNALKRDDERMFNTNSQIDWVVAGGESGSNARPMHPSWARSLRDQCVAAGVAFHYKQHGEWLSELGTGNYRNMSIIHSFGDGYIARRVGKLIAGRTLDGRTWDEFPRSHA